MATLLEKAERLRVDLGFEQGLSLVKLVDLACNQLGLTAEMEGKPLPIKLDACLAVLGGSAETISPEVIEATIVEAVAQMGTSVNPVSEQQQPKYRLESRHMTWQQHEDSARQLGCTLASITSEADWQQACQAAAGQTVWIGGMRHGSGNGSGPETWHWSNGKSWGFTRWCRGEPNNYQGREDRVQV